MPSVQNRSRFSVSVAKHPELTRHFPFNKTKAVVAYVGDLKNQRFKPKLDRADDVFEVRIRQKGFKPLTHTCKSAAEAQQFIDKISEERARGLFIDYTKGWNTTFADLITRYITEEAPKHKSFEMEAYKLNALLEDAGVKRVNLADVLAKHLMKLDKKLREPSGHKMRESATTVEWVNKPFAQLLPTDINDYISERLEVVMPATVDREIDIFSAICRLAIRTWRIPVAQSPMEGVMRPRYFNERDRRLKARETELLLDAARIEDRRLAVSSRMAELLCQPKLEAAKLLTKYARKQAVKSA